MFVCLGLTSLLNIWGHITTVPICSRGNLTNVLPNRNTIPQTQYMTPHPVIVYRHGVDLSLCYPLMWNVTLKYIATHFKDPTGKYFPDLPHTKAGQWYWKEMNVTCNKYSRINFIIIANINSLHIPVYTFTIEF